MRTLWILLLTGRAKTSIRDYNLYRWRDRFKREGLTASLRLELRETLTPRISLREPFRWPSRDGEDREAKRIKDLVEWEMVLSTDHVHSSVRELRDDEHWAKALPVMLMDFSGLLRDALDLMRELGDAGDTSDLSYVHHPSIGEHAQNEDYHDWTALIDLTRDAWLATSRTAPECAALVARAWCHLPYPLFRRLAFFAAAHGNVISRRSAVDWLLADRHWWLWSVETQREAIRLLVALAPQLDQPMLGELEQAILGGPPGAMFNEHLDHELLSETVDRGIWMRLAKLVDAGAVVGNDANKRLKRLSAKYPDWKLAGDQRDEFPYWTGASDEWHQIVATPRRRRELVEWLKHPPGVDRRNDDDWRQRCRDSFATTACALYALSQQNVWPSERWRAAIQAWSEEKLVKRSWRRVAPVLASAPLDVLDTLGPAISWWLQAVAKHFDAHEAIFFAFSHRILAMDCSGCVDTDDPVFKAINHPVGHVTEGLLRWWYRHELEDGKGLPEELRDTLSELCNSQIEKFKYGRVVIAANVIALFRVDPNWAIQHLLPLFDWQRSKSEARAAWEGFLWSPRLYRPLMQLLKRAFLETGSHYAMLGKHNGQYASLLTFAALDSSDTFTIAELGGAARALPNDGLVAAAQTLVRAQEGAGDQRAEYWTNRVAPYLHAIWPKSRSRFSSAIAESFARLCVAALDAFPEALAVLRGWLQPLAHPDYVVRRLHEEHLCAKFPESTLEFLDLVFGDQTQWIPTDLGACLDTISVAVPPLTDDPRFERLKGRWRSNGRS